MSDEARPQFTLADAMVLVSATAVALALLRIAYGLRLFETYLPGRTLLYLGRILVEYLCVAGGCILTPFMLAVLVMRIRQLWPTPGEALHGPGFMASVAVLVASVLPVTYYVVRVIIPIKDDIPTFSVFFNNSFWNLVHGSGPMIIGVWLAMALSGRWKLSPSWADRLGCAIGFFWILIYLYAELFLIVHPLLLWLSW